MNSTGDKAPVLPELLAILRESVGKRPQITADTTLFGDLSIYGDDAAELIEALRECFGVDFSEFRFDNHFLSESYSWPELVVLPYILLRRLYRRWWSHGTPEEGEGLVPVTVRQLTEVVRMKRWPAAWSRLEDKGTADSRRSGTRA
jgi:hypothetical protein